MTACRCWNFNNALGHDDHCCFRVDGKWRDDDEICHVEEGRVLMGATS